jgi:hypothetical protein
MNEKVKEALIQKLVDADQYNIMHDNHLLVYILREGTKGYNNMTEHELLQAAGQEDEEDKEVRRATDPSDEELGLDGEELTANNLTPEGMGPDDEKE